MKLLYTILAVDVALLLWANGQTNAHPAIAVPELERPKTGLTIENRPVIVITMETNHVYTLWTNGSGSPCSKTLP